MARRFPRQRLGSRRADEHRRWAGTFSINSVSSTSRPTITNFKNAFHGAMVWVNARSRTALIIGNEATAKLFALIQNALIMYSIAVTAGVNSGIRLLLLLLMMILAGAAHGRFPMVPCALLDGPLAAPLSRG